MLLALVAACAVTTPASAQQSPQQVTLRWKYEQGTELVYRMTNHQEAEMPAMGGTSVTDQIQTMRWRVVEVAPNGDATITVTTERIQLDTRGPTGNLTFDSQTGEVPDNPQARLMAAMAGLSHTIVIAPDGQVKAVRGLDELRKTMLEGMPPEAAGMMGGMLEEMFSEESMTRMMQQSVQTFPPHPVGAGESWSNAFSMPIPMLGTMTTNLAFTVTGIERREGRTFAVISTTGTMALDESASSQLGAALEMRDTKLTGSIDFDVDRGITVGSELSTTMQMSITAAGNAMTVGMTQTMSLELVEYVSA